MVIPGRDLCDTVDCGVDVAEADVKRSKAKPDVVGSPEVGNDLGQINHGLGDLPAVLVAEGDVRPPVRGSLR